MSTLNDKSGIAIEDSIKKQGLIRSYAEFLRSSKAAVLLVFIVLMLFPVFSTLRTLISFLFFNKWQLSGYYIGAIEWGTALFLMASWLVSIGILFWNRQYKQGLLRIVAIPFIFLFTYVVIISFICLLPMCVFTSEVSGWPIDSVYSKSRQKYFILAREPAMTDTCYRIFSAKYFLLNPVWIIETTDFDDLDYSEDGSLTKKPSLILSGDEELLVVSRGGHFTDAVLVDYMQPMTDHVYWADKNREQQWQQRTDQIKTLLQKHARCN